MSTWWCHQVFELLSLRANLYGITESLLDAIVSLLDPLHTHPQVGGRRERAALRRGGAGRARARAKKARSASATGPSHAARATTPI